MNRKEISKLVYEYKTKYTEGFTDIEQEIFLLKYFPNIDKDKYHKRFFGTTCMRIDGLTITYRTDIITSILCDMENRDISIEEFD